jgi:acetyltransferase-like isoleucine patch superfamily enzyme
VVVGAGSTIGARSLLCPGARVGDGAIVAPTSVVRAEVAAGARVGGNPARELGPAPAEDLGQG